MCCYFQMECRRWAPTYDGWIFRFSFWLKGCWIDGWGLAPLAFVGLRVSRTFSTSKLYVNLSRIVEYATRDQAQNAVSTLSNQNLMGRLVYVREVSLAVFKMHLQESLQWVQLWLTMTL